MMSLPEVTQKMGLNLFYGIPQKKARRKRLGEKRSRNEKLKSPYELQSVLPS